MLGFVEFSPDQQLLLPPDMREWIPDDDIVHFSLAAENADRGATGRWRGRAGAGVAVPAASDY